MLVSHLPSPGPDPARVPPPWSCKRSNYRHLIVRYQIYSFCIIRTARPAAHRCSRRPAASVRRCRPRRARPPCRWRSTQTASGATRRTSRPRCISAPWRRCRTPL